MNPIFAPISATGVDSKRVAGYNRGRWCFYREKVSFWMYKKVLLTDKEISILKTLISENIRSNFNKEAVNLTIILNRLREKNPH